MNDNWKTELDQIRASPRLTLKNFLPMLFVRFGSRDLLWLVLVVSIIFGWWANTRDLRNDRDSYRKGYFRLAEMLYRYGFESDEGNRHDTQWRIAVPENLRDELGPVIVSDP